MSRRQELLGGWARPPELFIRGKQVMTYFAMQGEDRFQIGDVITVTDYKRLSFWRWLKKMWRLRTFKGGRYELITTDYLVKALSCGQAETLQLPEGWDGPAVF